MSDKLLEDDVIAYQVTGDYPPGMSGSEFRTRIATLALEALRHRCRYVQRIPAPDTIKEMVRQSLEAGGFDGLYNPGECACKKDDLFPCGDPSMIGCHPGYVQPCGTDCGEHDWHIVKVKPASKDADMQSISRGSEPK